jgi:hypothetical protein
MSCRCIRILYSGVYGKSADFAFLGCIFGVHQRNFASGYSNGGSRLLIQLYKESHCLIISSSLSISIHNNKLDACTFVTRRY